jgi:hypothetical protein
MSVFKASSASNILSAILVEDQVDVISCTLSLISILNGLPSN